MFDLEHLAGFSGVCLHMLRLPERLKPPRQPSSPFLTEGSPEGWWYEFEFETPIYGQFQVFISHLVASHYFALYFIGHPEHINVLMIFSQVENAKLLIEQRLKKWKFGQF